MNLSEISIRRPVTVFMVTLIVLLFGVVSLTKLPVELYANTSFGEISIIIQVRGGIPPTEVETQVTKIVEEGVATVSNLQQLLSISKEGESTVVLSFQSGTDMEFAALEVREKFAKVKNQLPKEIEKPVIAQFQQGDVPVIIVSATSEVRSTEDIRKIVDGTMKESLKRIGGVANVEVAGGRERKIIVDVDQVKLASFGIPIDELTSTLGANNLNLLSGEIERKTDRFLVRMMGEFETVAQINEMALRVTPLGTIIRVKDVATVKDSFMEAKEYARLNVKPVVTLYVQKESSKNTITVAQDLVKEIDSLKNKLPKDIHLVITSNQSEFIKKAIDNLTGSLLEGIILIILTFLPFLYRLDLKRFAMVGALIFLTLFSKFIFPFHHELVLNLVFVTLVGTLVIRKKYRPILIVTAPIPISCIGAFIFMRSWGLTVNVMTLFGLALGVGMLVDNAIVVFENILKMTEEGKDVFEASGAGASAMFLTLVASTATNVIVFLPLVFMGAELQKLYSGMAATIVVTLMISMVCAVTIVPMMCARKMFSVQSVVDEQMSGKADKKGGLAKFKVIQRKFLFKSIRYRKRVALIALATFLGSVHFASKLGSEYLGSTEQNKFTAYVEMPTGVKLEASDKVVKKVEKIVAEIPEVVNVSSRIEGWSSKVYVEVTKASNRKRTVDEIIETLRPQTDKLSPAFVYFQQDEQVGTKEVTLEVFGHSYEKLRELAIAIANRLGQIKGLTDTKIRMREGRPEMQVIVNKKRAGVHGLSVHDTANQIHGQMRGLRATVFHTEGTEIETISRLDEKYRKTFKDLHNLIITNKDGDPLVLDQLADFKFGLGPSEIWRKDRNRMIQVSANIGKVPLSQVVEEIRTGMKTVPFPEDYFYRIGGDYPTMVRTSKQLKMMIAFVLVLVYLVLASLFESFYQPVLIMIAVPLALCGAVAALYMGPKTLGVGAMLGMMMLGGIVVNNTIMLVDRINYYIAEGLSMVKAAVLATQDRMRPILMTMSGSVLGLFPMAIDQSEGANLWSPLAMTVIGGTLSSTVLTLMVTPAFFILFQDFLGLFRRHPAKANRKADPPADIAIVN